MKPEWVPKTKGEYFVWGIVGISLSMVPLPKDVTIASACALYCLRVFLWPSIREQKAKELQQQTEERMQPHFLLVERIPDLDNVVTVDLGDGPIRQFESCVIEFLNRNGMSILGEQLKSQRTLDVGITQEQFEKLQNAFGATAEVG